MHAPSFARVGATDFLRTSAKRQDDEGHDGDRDDENSDYCVGRAKKVYLIDWDGGAGVPCIRDLAGHRGEPRGGDCVELREKLEQQQRADD